MLVNYQTNNRQPSFGRFRFSNNAKEVVLSKINTPAKFKKFKELCELEETGDRARRNIDIFFVRHFTDRLYTEIGPKDYLQGIFQSTNSFLKKMTKKADELQKQKQTSGHSDCKESHGLISCYRWFDYFGTLFVGVETPTYKLVMLQAQPTS